jgi:hypothetical protein
MVELVDTLVLEASVERHPSSSLGWGTKYGVEASMVMLVKIMEVRRSWRGAADCKSVPSGELVRI